MKNIFNLVAGLLFGLGLAVSGMINPAKVIGFLDITGDWDPSLAFVMGGGVLVTSLTFRLVLRRSAPVFSDIFHLPTKNDIDRRLITGAAIFGVGWAAAGLCPGPALASIGLFDVNILIFVLALVVGSIVANRRFLVRDSTPIPRLGE